MNPERKQEASHMYGCIEQANTIHILQYCMNIHLVEAETMLKNFLRIERNLPLLRWLYTGYKKLMDKTLCGCLVHAKRKFHEAYEVNRSNEYAKQGETYLRKLFRLEDKADESALTLEKRLEMRKIKSKQVLDEFYS